ncbi:hypothetical protein [Kaarinaea lacus]
MDPDSKESKIARLKSDWVEDAVQLQKTPVWKKRFAVGVTAISCILYAVLYALVSQYRLQVEEHIRELPIFTRVVLNISQPFLIVLIIISLSLLVLLYLRIKKPWLSHKSLLVLIGFNGIFAAVLLMVSVFKVI